MQSHNWIWSNFGLKLSQFVLVTIEIDSFRGSKARFGPLLLQPSDKMGREKVGQMGRCCCHYGEPGGSPCQKQSQQSKESGLPVSQRR